MLKIIVITILIGCCAASCNNFCSIVNENLKHRRYVEKNFTLHPVVSRNTANGKIDLTGGNHIICLEMKPIACSEKIFCLGCCNFSEDKTYHGYRTRIENRYSCGTNECCRDTDLSINPTERGCEIFLESDRTE
ncbi:hypothetical protein WA026_001045 [Henosepilachna vigintioctopunctata]|uniref:Uncharacterized protein n=1 Tax=Henosepilachna vigintioctopunctata TaxID=420089 RepID=A0AAW1UZL3_9CUCU